VGQRIDLSLMDSAISWLANVGGNYLVSGRFAAATATLTRISYPTSVSGEDRHIAIGIGNDGQWRKFCEIAGARDLASDGRSRPIRTA